MTASHPVQDTPRTKDARALDRGAHAVVTDAGLAWSYMMPALGVIALVALFPIVWTGWESVHLHDLRMPWRGRLFVGTANYAEALRSARFWRAIGHTVTFAGITTAIELTCGLALAMMLDQVSRGRGLVRTAVLLPWAIPTVVVALVWRFLFESPGGLVNALLARGGAAPPTWFAGAITAWVPPMLADIWKMTPFVTVLLLAGLQGIDRSLYEAARMDSAGPVRRFVEITLPLLAPAIFVAFMFRALDAFRVFDVIYVMTGGGPGTATEPIALLTFTSLLQNLRFGYGAALSIIVFAATLGFAALCLALVGKKTLLGQDR